MKREQANKQTKQANHFYPLLGLSPQNEFDVSVITV